MKKLNELIQKLCPDGVEYKRLGEIATISRGGNFQKKDYVEMGVPCIHYGQIYTQYSLFAEKTISFISEGKAKKQKMAVKNDVIMAVTSENIDDVCKCIAWLGEEEAAVSGHTAIIHHTINPKYLVYYLHSSMFYKQKTKLAHGTKVIEVTPDKLLDIILPVPPMEIQSEIVRILDNFTERTAELTSELMAEHIARKKQYEYYRNSILTENQDYTTTLGEACDFVRGPFGGSLKKEIFQKSGYAVYEQQHAIYGDFTFRYFVDEEKYQSMLRFAVHAGDLIMSCSGTMGKIAIIPEDAPQGIINQALLKLTAKKGVNNKYLKHCFENSIAAQMNAAARGGAIKNVASVSELKDITINLPPLEEQERIVAILDRFDSTCSGISEGLPAEIENRRKQYEYYRDKLLTFKQLS